MTYLGRANTVSCYGVYTKNTYFRLCHAKAGADLSL